MYLALRLVRALSVSGSLAWTSSTCPCCILRGGLDGADHPVGRRVDWVDALSSACKTHGQLSPKL